MKNLFVFIVLLTSSTIAIGQTKSATEKALQARIIALDTQGWEAWKNNDSTWFKENTIDGFLSISSDGISNKAEVVKSTATDCKVTAYSLAAFTPKGTGAKCGASCHAIAKAKDFVFTAYGKR